VKTVVCFGDSNTWGYVPGTGERYPYSQRWTSVLQQELGTSYLVIPEGLNGRTTVFEDPVSGDRNGLRHLYTVLASHKPIDLIVILLGTNDLKSRFSLHASEIAKAVGRLVSAARASDCGPGGADPAILLCAPARIVYSPAFADEFGGAEDTSAQLAEAYSQIARQQGVGFLDAGEYAESSPVDGIHWSADSHARFGRGAAEAVRSVLP
jgi:lysophospholipase L1-like esterase